MSVTIVTRCRQRVKEHNICTVLSYHFIRIKAYNFFEENFFLTAKNHFFCVMLIGLGLLCLICHSEFFYGNKTSAESVLLPLIP
jgi:hypothetical protein